MSQQAGCPCQQGEPAQRLDGQAQVAECRPAGSCAVQRKGPAEDLGVHAPDRAEEAQVWAGQLLLLGDAEDHRRTRVATAVEVVPEAGEVTTLRPPLAHGRPGQVVPRLVARRWRL